MLKGFNFSDGCLWDLLIGHGHLQRQIFHLFQGFGTFRLSFVSICQMSNQTEQTAVVNIRHGFGFIIQPIKIVINSTPCAKTIILLLRVCNNDNSSNRNLSPWVFPQPSLRNDKWLAWTKQQSVDSTFHPAIKYLICLNSNVVRRRSLAVMDGWQGCGPSHDVLSVVVIVVTDSHCFVTHHDIDSQWMSRRDILE